MDNKTLVTHYPKISFPDTTISLKDLNQFPKSVLFVEEMGLTSSNNRL